jgi:hypothetical protein
VPSRAYQDKVFELASRQAVLAGIRMARLVGAALAQPNEKEDRR